MDSKPIFKSQLHPFIIFLVSTTTTSSTPLLPPLPPPPRSPPHNYALKPSMTIIVGALTTLFSITFLLLLYAKHCRRSSNPYPPTELTAVRFSDRDHSGIDRTIIESLPVFRFGSLTGQKDGLECAVCLSVFDPSEVLRLLPKCKHAFHVECVDTWLDAHSTCPLCRYRVDPEDIFLILGENESSQNVEIQEERELPLRRVSGRHSSAGEKVTGLQITVETSSSTSPLPAAATATTVAGTRRSLDSWSGKKKMKKLKKKEEKAFVKAVSAVCVDRQRKDGLLLAEAEAVTVAEEEERRSFEKRFSHRIVVGKSGAQRWSDVQPSDLLYLRSDDVRRSKRSRPSVLHEGNNGWWQGGRNVINSRSVSELTGLSRFGSNGEAGVVSRLLARLSEPKSGRNSLSSNV